ncbi:hypothetical protein NKR23_g6784 [Pleurostoma richardsiae]|uniref:Uncharacterized protein n=1 Tax=Pleurostoma richardsiae TaxID=41990 RepID=A0AA38RPF2_9PEZI|nr:hypothetical protein NKR23_g6784 [Pleurostoma richardsiae]
MSDHENESPTKPAPDEKVKLTDRELEILGKAWSCLKTLPEIDYEKLASELGMSNHRSAANAWGLIKKKLAIVLPTISKANKEPKTPKTASKRKTPAKAADAAGGADDDEDAVETPTKKPRGPRKTATPGKSRAKKGKKGGEEDKPKDEAADEAETQDDPTNINVAKAEEE